MLSNNNDSNSYCYILYILVSDFFLVVGGHVLGGQPFVKPLASVEAVSADSNPLPNYMKNLNDFPKTIYSAVGTTFGKLLAKLVLQTEDALAVLIVGLVQFTTTQASSKQSMI